MNEIIETLERKIAVEKCSLNMTPEHQSYIVGLADALQIVEEISRKQLVIGRKYYVLMPSDYNNAKVEEMVLYRINAKKKPSYCFAKDRNNPKPDLVLHSDIGIKSRVFGSMEAAQNGIPFFLLSLRDKRYLREDVINRWNK